jgi:ubiquinone/menaquinone biosynthesis C-methylase UbiE
MESEGRDRIPIESTGFYDDAQRYDLISGALSEAGPVEFYRRHAMRYGNPVLELACGSGRLSIPMASSGIEVVGLDASPEMLRLAERKATVSGVDVNWVHGDMRSFDLRRQFRAIFVASNSFSHLYSRADIEACLAAIRRHLAASGRFVVEVFNPALGMFVRPPEHRSAVAEYEDSQRRRRIAVSKAVRYDSATQITHEIWYFRDDVTGEEQEVSLNLRMFFPQEIDALLHYNGFQIDKKYGDHVETPFGDSSRKQIIVCRAGATAV